METLNGESRLFAARAGHKLVKRFAGMSAAKLEHRTAPLKDAVVVLDKTHGWNKPDQGSQALVQINIASGQHREAPVVDIEGL
jgi:hypothetical protein